MSTETEGSHTRPAPTGIGGLLRNIGPGVVVSGSVVGSGELLVTTHMGAEVGFVFLWGVIVASVVKYFIQLELGRQRVQRRTLPGLRQCITSKRPGPDHTHGLCQQRLG